MNNTLRLMFTVFAANASICMEKGLSVKDCAGINKEAATSMFGLSNEAADIAVAEWINACKSNGALK